MKKIFLSLCVASAFIFTLNTAFATESSDCKSAVKCECEKCGCDECACIDAVKCTCCEKDKCICAEKCTCCGNTACTCCTDKSNRKTFKNKIKKYFLFFKKDKCGCCTIE